MVARVVTPDVAHGGHVDSDIPGRLDALGWSRWHRRVVIALGITWVLDGLEASLIANLGPTLEDARTLGLGAAQVGLVNTVYLIGQVVGALVFGHLTDRAGRKRLFLVTLSLYLAATALSGAAPDLAVFLVFRFLAGAGIGGEYSAINSAIDELVPAHLRGRIDLAINGSYWIGVAGGAALTLVVLDPAVLPVEVGWRVAFGLGALLGIAILVIRRELPESPRWLLGRGHVRAAEATVAGIEAAVHGAPGPRAAVPRVRVHVKRRTGLAHVARTLIVRYPRRAVLGAVLMVTQAFLYNAIFFSYALVLERFHHVAADDVGLYIFPFAVANFFGPLLLGRHFDVRGRRTMIPLTYAASGLLLLATGGLFVAGLLTAVTQTLAWAAVFFVASAAASAAYLTVSELFPVELRGLAIAIFYGVGTLAGAFAPLLFGAIVASGEPSRLFAGYVLAAALMLTAAVVARRLGVAAEGRSLEELAELA